MSSCKLTYTACTTVLYVVSATLRQTLITEEISTILHPVVPNIFALCALFSKVRTNTQYASLVNAFAFRLFFKNGFILKVGPGSRALPLAWQWRCHAKLSQSSWGAPASRFCLLVWLWGEVRCVKLVVTWCTGRCTALSLQAGLSDRPAAALANVT